MHPYSLNGAPLDVKAGDWFVGKAAVSVVVKHPVLGQVQIFNTHVSKNDNASCLASPHNIGSSSQKVEKMVLNTTEPIASSTHGSFPS